MKNEHFLAWLAFGAVSIIWGTTYLAIAVAITTLPTFVFPGIRFMIGGVILLCISLARGRKLPRRARDWANVVLIGFLMVAIGNVAVVFAEHHMSSGFAALLVATSPFWMAMLERARRDGDRLTPRSLLGMIVGFAGVGVLVAPELVDHFNVGFAIAVIVLQLSTFAWTLGSIRGKYDISPEVGPIMAASLQMIFGGLAATLIGLATGESLALHFTTGSLAAFAYLTIFGSVIAYTSYVYAISRLPTTTVALHTYINPAIAVVVGWIFLREPLHWNAIVAMIIIFAGVALVESQRRTPASKVAATAVPENVVVGD